MKFYLKDPKVLDAKFNSTCSRCGGKISRGDRIVYWPLVRVAVCWGCGEKDYLEFRAAAMDEDGTPL